VPCCGGPSQARALIPLFWSLHVGSLVE
jgi:hypothetical protein